jgi:hypothetical protein
VRGAPLFLAALLAARAAPAATHALVLGQDEGLPAEPPLQFAQTDAALLARALVDVQVAPRERVRLLAGAAQPEMAAALGALAAAAGPADTVLVFFSGHGGPEGVHVAGRVWPWEEIRAALQASPARLVVAFFDSCRSGALLSAKGQLLRGPPLQLAAEPLAPAGRFFISSSGASELSYESTRLRASPFALALRSGLRGPADGDGDGRITLQELYTFLYTRTVAATLAAPAGPQHPVQLTELRGAGEAVLVDRLGPGGIHRASAALGTCYLLDRAQSRVLGELPARAGAGLRLSPGTYAISCLSDGAGHGPLRSGSVTLADGAVELESIPLRAAPPSFALAKGPLALARHDATLGGGLLSGWAGGRTATLALGYQLRQGGFTLAPQLTLARGRSLLLAAAAAVELPWWQVLGSRLQLGIELGAQIGGPAGRALLLGPWLRLQRPLDGDGRLSFFADLALPTFYPTGGGGVLSALQVLAGLRLSLDRREDD